VELYENKHLIPIFYREHKSRFKKNNDMLCLQNNYAKLVGQKIIYFYNIAFHFFI